MRPQCKRQDEHNQSSHKEKDTGMPMAPAAPHSNCLDRVADPNTLLTCAQCTLSVCEARKHHTRAGWLFSSGVRSDMGPHSAEVLVSKARHAAHAVGQPPDCKRSTLQQLQAATILRHLAVLRRSQKAKVHCCTALGADRNTVQYMMSNTCQSGGGLFEATVTSRCNNQTKQSNQQPCNLLQRHSPATIACRFSLQAVPQPATANPSILAPPAGAGWRWRAAHLQRTHQRPCHQAFHSRSRPKL